MPAPLKVDYPTDEDSDGDAAGFSIKIPDLSDLINEFEKDDEVLFKAADTIKQYKADYKAKGLEFNAREIEIRDDKKDKQSLLDANMSTQREEWTSRLPGMLEDINEVIKDPKNKIYIR